MSLDSLHRSHSSRFSTLYHQQLAHSSKVKYFFSVILILYILLMIFMNRLCQRKGNSNRGSRRRVSTHTCVFFLFFFYILYLLYPRMAATLSLAPDHHYLHNHLQPLQGARNTTYFHTLTLIPTTTSTCQHTTAVFGENVRQMGGSRRVYVSSTGIFFLC